ncbi:MAG: bifunctional enoyl-CoA hydratase/phosphate acetyltransferase [Pseudodonghicola sp.]|nr:bifunctional enoyl-CoA hydratase/phosphate acetyltransferase [Pseudodonghicola sp.]
MARHHHIFSDLIHRAQALDAIPVAVVYPLSEVSLRGACEAADEGLVTPTLIAPSSELSAFAASLDIDISKYEIVDASSPEAAAAVGVALCRSGKAELLMKGSLHTDHLMHAVMQDTTGLRTHRRLSHVFVLDVPASPRMLMISDAAINIYPTLTDKVDIVQNAIDLAHVLRVADPKVAILSAVETVTPKITSTIEAAALCKMAERGQITGGTLDGPLAFDNAVNLKAAEIKHIQSPVAGVADILIVPDLEAGNMLAKQLEYLADSEAAGVVLGARVPIILTSRADSAKSRLASAAVAVLLAHAQRLAQPEVAAFTGVHTGGHHD